VLCSAGFELNKDAFWFEVVYDSAAGFDNKD